MSAKRARPEDDTIKIKICMPSREDTYSTSYPDEWKAVFRFSAAKHPTFFNVWERMKNWMIIDEDTGAVISNLDTPLEQLNGVCLVARQFTALHKELEEAMNQEYDERAYAIVSREIEALEKLVSDRKTHIAEIQKRLCTRKPASSEAEQEVRTRLREPELIELEEITPPVAAKTREVRLHLPPARPRCVLCDETFASVSNLQQHYCSEKHRKKANGIDICHYCHRVFVCDSDNHYFHQIACARKRPRDRVIQQN